MTSHLHRDLLRDQLWKASPATRMAELLHAANVPLGLVTNGEHWMLVHAPRGETTAFASWYAPLWFEEPITFQAFQALLSVQRFFGVSDDQTIEALLTRSAKDQQEVTEQLGWQVRKAVEVLIQALDKIDQDHNRKLLEGIGEKQLYESALTVMMRLVFLMCAEERKIFFQSESDQYDQFYAVSTLREQLQEIADKHVEEVLDARFDAWSRLLATFRAVYGGVQHDAMRLPPYGGTLFDPDRFPFLEGRRADTRWHTAPAEPIKVSNRTVLHLLNALQVLQVKVPGGGVAEARRISFRALDIEQIGHVYEGLLDHTAKRAPEPVLGLRGGKDGEPEIALSKLEALRAKSVDELVEFLKEATGRSDKALKRAVTDVELMDEQHLLIACNHDQELTKRVRPYAELLREDTLGYPVVINTGSIYVTQGSDRRSTGTHYTPRSLTEPIVQHTLEPLVYVGPAEGSSREQWKLKSAREILELKVCDMAMGSGAFLVQTCRYMAERLVEAWQTTEKEHPGCFVITPEGELSTGSPGERLLPKDPAERLTIARRFVADRCLYGVDINPMAVEMAKLSLWLITLQRDRPFTFLDHAFKCGDSLLGVSSVKQIECFSLRVKEGEAVQHGFATANLFRYVDEAAEKRRALENLPSNDHTQIEAKNRLHAEAEVATSKVKALADCLIGFELRGLTGEEYEVQRASAAEHAELAMRKLLADFQTHSHEQLHGRRPLQWPVEFPEVFTRGGFDAFVGNPPFMGGSKITGALGEDYRTYCVESVANGKRGNADLCTYFFLRVLQLLNSDHGSSGLVATNTIAQGDTREVGLDQLDQMRAVVVRGISSAPWPGSAALEVAHVWLRRGRWQGTYELDGRRVRGITSYLRELEATSGTPNALIACRSLCANGTKIYGDGFTMSPTEARRLIESDSRNLDVLKPYLNGDDLNSSPDQEPSRWVINFGERSLEEAKAYPLCFAVVDTKVRPYRQSLDGSASKAWWRFERPRSEVYETIRTLTRVLVGVRHTKFWCPVWCAPSIEFSDALVLFLFDDDGRFALIASTLHELWARAYSGSLETRLRYSPSDCLETFPFPHLGAQLNAVGSHYQKLGHGIMQERQQGLTKIYNRFHETCEKSEDIARLRALHVEMDRAVAVAYGWRDLDLGHGFHETKQGVRYTISESARRTVLDRLLALNHQRCAEEVKAGLHEKGAKRGKGKKARTQADDFHGDLFRGTG